uniref:heme NO-binding domain-containing protein n=1 Tax=Paracoccus sp. TRP TaxID=412597 RepID=UPI00178CF48A
MHGLINRCIEAFIRSNYDRDTWNQVVTKVGIKADSFLTWNEVSDNITYSIVITSAKILEKSVNEFLEDMGSWLTRQEKIRRLLRFSGSSFEEFTESLGCVDKKDSP